MTKRGGRFRRRSFLFAFVAALSSALSVERFRENMFAARLNIDAHSARPGGAINAVDFETRIDNVKIDLD